MAHKLNDRLKIGPKGLALIKQWEGYKTKQPDGSCKAYLDRIANPPIWTIGYGCTEDVHEGDHWTHAEAIERLLEEISEHEDAVKQVINVPLNQNQFDALVSFSYNYGIIRAKTLQKYVNAKDWENAGNCLVNVYAVVRGKGVINGLVNRRNAERKLLWTLPTEEVVEASRKLSLLSRIRGFLVSLLPAGGLAEYLGFLEPLKEFIVDHRYWFVAGSLMTLWLIMKWFEQKTVEDHESGNYTPSKAEKYEAHDDVSYVLDEDEIHSEVPSVPQPAPEPWGDSGADPTVPAQAPG